MKIRIFAVLLLAAVCFAMFTGCSAVNALQQLDRVEDAIDHRLDVAEEKLENQIESAFTETAVPNAQSPDAAPAQTASADAKQIAKEEALSIALNHVGLTEDQISRLHIQFGYDDGHPEYDVDFHYDGMEYDYEIHAETGKILHSEIEPADRIPESASKADTTAAAPAQAPAQSAEKRLTSEEVRDIALNHAGLSANDVKGLRVEFDYDDGRPEYDVDFRSGGYEYEYEIHAETGDIITWDKEWDD